MSPCRQCGVTALKSLYYCKNCTLIVHTHCLKAFLESGAQECSGSKKAVRDEKIQCVQTVLCVSIQLFSGKIVETQKNAKKPE